MSSNNKYTIDLSKTYVDMSKINSLDHLYPLKDAPLLTMRLNNPKATNIPLRAQSAMPQNVTNFQQGNNPNYVANNTNLQKQQSYPVSVSHPQNITSGKNIFRATIPYADPSTVNHFGHLQPNNWIPNSSSQAPINAQAINQNNLSVPQGQNVNQPSNQYNNEKVIDIYYAEKRRFEEPAEQYSTVVPNKIIYDNSTFSVNEKSNVDKPLNMTDSLIQKYQPNPKQITPQNVAVNLDLERRARMASSDKAIDSTRFSRDYGNFRDRIFNETFRIIGSDVTSLSVPNYNTLQDTKNRIEEQKIIKQAYIQSLNQNYANTQYHQQTPVVSQQSTNVNQQVKPVQTTMAPNVQTPQSTIQQTKIVSQTPINQPVHKQSLSAQTQSNYQNFVVSQTENVKTIANNDIPLNVPSDSHKHAWFGLKSQTKKNNPVFKQNEKLDVKSELPANSSPVADQVTSISALPSFVNTTPNTEQILVPIHLDQSANNNEKASPQAINVQSSSDTIPVNSYVNSKPNNNETPFSQNVNSSTPVKNSTFNSKSSNNSPINNVQTHIATPIENDKNTVDNFVSNFNNEFGLNNKVSPEQAVSVNLNQDFYMPSEQLKSTKFNNNFVSPLPELNDNRKFIREDSLNYKVIDKSADDVLSIANNDKDETPANDVQNDEQSTDSLEQLLHSLTDELKSVAQIADNQSKNTPKFKNNPDRRQNFQNTQKFQNTPSWQHPNQQKQTIQPTTFPKQNFINQTAKPITPVASSTSVPNKSSNIRQNFQANTNLSSAEQATKLNVKNATFNFNGNNEGDAPTITKEKPTFKFNRDAMPSADNNLKQPFTFKQPLNENAFQPEKRNFEKIVDSRYNSKTAPIADHVASKQTNAIKPVSKVIDNKIPNQIPKENPMFTRMPNKPKIIFTRQTDEPVQLKAHSTFNNPFESNIVAHDSLNKISNDKFVTLNNAVKKPTNKFPTGSDKSDSGDGGTSSPL